MCVRPLIPKRLEHESEKERGIGIPPNTSIRCSSCTMSDSIFQGFICGTGRDMMTLRLLALAISRWCIRRHNIKTKKECVPKADSRLKPLTIQQKLLYAPVQGFFCLNLGCFFASSTMSPLRSSRHRHYRKPPGAPVFIVWGSFIISDLLNSVHDVA